MDDGKLTPADYDRQEVVASILPLLLQLKEAGCSTFVDCAPQYLGRDPYILKELSEKSGLYLITNTGLYKHPYLPSFVYQASEQELAELSLLAAIDHARQLLEKAEITAILSDQPVLRYGLRERVRQLAERLNAPAVSMLLGKSAFDEQHPNYIGMYSGAFGSQQVSAIVESADCLIAVGLVWSDINTALFTAKLDSSRMINIQAESV